MSWVSDIAGGVGDAVSSLVSGVESMFGDSGSSSSDASSPALNYTASDLQSAWNPTTLETPAPYAASGASADKMANPLTVNGGNGPAPAAGGAWSTPIYQGALATGAMRLLGGALTPNPMAMQINAQNTWTQEAIARAAANQKVDKVVIPHVSATTPRRGLIGTNIG
jgi:hypothetical protein